MRIQRVQQDSPDGCFVACVAMLLHTHYREAFHLIFPHRCIWEKHELSTDEAEQRLRDLKFGVKPVKIRDTRFLKKISLLFVRWEANPTRGHTVIYQPETGLFIDPNYRRPLTRLDYERQLYRAYHLDVPWLYD